MVGASELARKAPYAIRNRIFPPVEPALAHHVHTLVGEPPGRHGYAVRERKRFARIPPRETAPPASRLHRLHVLAELDPRLAPIRILQNETRRHRPIAFDELYRQAFSPFRQRERQRARRDSAPRTRSAVATDLRPLWGALLRFEPERCNTLSVRRNLNQHRSGNFAENERILGGRSVRNRKRLMPIWPFRSAESPVGAATPRRPCRRRSRNFVIPQRSRDVNPEMRKPIGIVPARSLSDTGYSVKVRHRNVASLPTVRNYKPL